MDPSTSSADLRAASVPTKRQHARTAKLGGPAQVAFALSDPAYNLESKRSTYAHLAAFVRPDAGKPKDRRGDTGLFTRRRAEHRQFAALTGPEEIEAARGDEEWIEDDVQGTWDRYAWTEFVYGEHSWGEYVYRDDGEEVGMSMEGLRGERRECGYGGLVERAVSSNRERLQRRLEGDGWEFVGGRFGERQEVESEGSEGSEVDEEFDVVVVCAS